jgi:acetate kinase
MPDKFTAGPGAVLTLNTGSSSIKFGLFAAGPMATGKMAPLLRGQIAAFQGF